MNPEIVEDCQWPQISACENRASASVCARPSSHFIAGESGSVENPVAGE